MNSQQEQREEPAFELSEQDVRTYLEAHPEFFENHPQLLDTIQLPHRSGGAVVSLVERQLERLRERTVQSERQLKEFVAIARSNEVLADKIHKLILQLLAVPERPARLAFIERELRDGFSVDFVSLLLFAPASAESDAEPAFVRTVNLEDPDALPFTALLTATQPRCGRLSKAQRDFLFGEQADEVESSALLPLAGAEPSRGLLVLGSRREDQFPPGGGTELLQRIADVTAAIVA